MFYTELSNGDINLATSFWLEDKSNNETTKTKGLLLKTLLAILKCVSKADFEQKFISDILLYLDSWNFRKGILDLYCANVRLFQSYINTEITNEDKSIFEAFIQRQVIPGLFENESFIHIEDDTYKGLKIYLDSGLNANDAFFIMLITNKAMDDISGSAKLMPNLPKVPNINVFNIIDQQYINPKLF
jgi:hypothetical protein